MEVHFKSTVLLTIAKAVTSKQMIIIMNKLMNDDDIYLKFLMDARMNSIDQSVMSSSLSSPSLPVVPCNEQCTLAVELNDASLFKKHFFSVLKELFYNNYLVNDQCVIGSAGDNSVDHHCLDNKTTESDDAICSHQREQFQVCNSYNKNTSDGNYHKKVLRQLMELVRIDQYDQQSSHTSKHSPLLQQVYPKIDSIFEAQQSVCLSSRNQTVAIMGEWLRPTSNRSTCATVSTVARGASQDKFALVNDSNHRHRKNITATELSSSHRNRNNCGSSASCQRHVATKSSQAFSANAPKSSIRHHRQSNSYLNSIKQLFQYMIIVNCLVFVVDNSLLQMKIGVFGMISNNHTASATSTAFTTVPAAMLPSLNRSYSELMHNKHRIAASNVQGNSDASHHGHSSPEQTLNPHDFDALNSSLSLSQSHIGHTTSGGHANHNAMPESVSDGKQQQHEHHEHHTNQHQNLPNSHGQRDSEGDMVQDSPQVSAEEGGHHTTTARAAFNSEQMGEINGCRSCQMREQLKQHNLASIKMHILARLAMSQPPNITKLPPISEQIIQSFYSQNGWRYMRKNSKAEFDTIERQGRRNYHSSDPDVNDMQGDDPMATAHQSFDDIDAYNYQDHESTVQHHHHRTVSSHEPALTQAHHHDHHHEYYHTRHMGINNIKKFDSVESNEPMSHKYHPQSEYNDEYDEYSSSSGSVYNMDYYDEVPEEVEETEEAFYSSTDSIYAFPNVSKARHRGDILEFTIKENNHLSVSGAVFNLFVRGQDWIRENEPNLQKNRPDDDGSSIDEFNSTSPTSRALYNSSSGSRKNRSRVSISINRFVPRNSHQQSQQRYTRTDGHFSGEIPKGIGKWIQFNITHMVHDWVENKKIVQEIVVKTSEPWMRQLLVLDTNSENRPYIEIQTRDVRKHRSKRHLAKDCRENDKQTRCCRYPLRVDFRDFGWDWIIAPDMYESYFCAGECPIGYLPKHPHTYLYSLSSSYSTCCTPRKLSSLTLLYFDENKQVIQSKIPNMSVEKCGCS